MKFGESLPGRYHSWQNKDTSELAKSEDAAILEALPSGKDILPQEGRKRSRGIRADDRSALADGFFTRMI